MSDVDLTGRTLAGRYDLLAHLGRGGMGSVYRAYDRELDELVALKVIRSDLADPAFVDRFRHEVKLARRVTSPHVARMFELGIAHDVTFCTMELVDGETLRARLRREVTLPVDSALDIACQLLDGLVAAHAVDIVHRDIKPDNILLARDGRVVLADFGIAALGVTDPVGVSGTARYMAPEQARGEPPSPASDVYAVGIVLREMLGEPTGDLANVIARATAPDLASRIRTATELRKLLDRESRQATFSLEPRTAVDELCTVVVVVPHATTDSRALFIAYGVHEAMLEKLARERRVRVLPRAAATGEPSTIVVDMAVAERLTVTISRGDRTPLVLDLPLAVDAIDATAAAATQAIATLARDPRTTPPEALELMLEARFRRRLDRPGTEKAIALLDKARTLAPHDAHIAAALASFHALRAFFAPGDDPLGRAKELIASALAEAPDHADTHVAAGLVELNDGEPMRAAAHFRRAIACAPYAAEAHDYLGRMLLEAGYFDAGLARCADAIAISPVFATRTRWDIARAYALENRWAEADAMVAELRAVGSRRDLTLFRFALWRRERATLTALRHELANLSPAFDPPFLDTIFAIALDDGWREHGPPLVEDAHNLKHSRRRQAFQLQFAAELAGYAGDLEACDQLLGRVADTGVFDLHWIDRCPVIPRDTPQFARARGRIRRRAEAILDALYGDADAVACETVRD